MVVQQLGLGKPPPEDAADALAIALCHLHNQTRLTLEDVKRL
jgi:Holliday junction resolvasome RuvABC endonuclease subunit